MIKQKITAEVKFRVTRKTARNLEDSKLTFSDHISAGSKSCLYHIRNLRRRLLVTPSIVPHRVV